MDSYRPSQRGRPVSVMPHRDRWPERRTSQQDRPRRRSSSPPFSLLHDLPRKDVQMVDDTDLASVGTPPGTPPLSPPMATVDILPENRVQDQSALVDLSPSSDSLLDDSLLRALAEAPEAVLVDSDEEDEDIISLGESRSPTPPPSFQPLRHRADTPPPPPQAMAKAARPFRSLIERITNSIAAAADDARGAVTKGPRPSDFTLVRGGRGGALTDVKTVAIKGKARSTERSTVGRDETSARLHEDSDLVSKDPQPGETALSEPLQIDTSSLASRLQARLAAEKALQRPARSVAPPLPRAEDLLVTTANHTFSDELRARLLARLEEERQKAAHQPRALQSPKAHVDDGVTSKSEETLKQEVLAALSARRAKRREVKARESELRLKVRLSRRRRSTLDGTEPLNANSAPSAPQRLDPKAREFVKASSESDLKATLQRRKSHSTTAADAGRSTSTSVTAPPSNLSQEAAARQAELKSRLSKLRQASRREPTVSAQLVNGFKADGDQTLQQRLKKEKLKALMGEQERKLKKLEDEIARSRGSQVAL